MKRLLAIALMLICIPAISQTRKSKEKPKSKKSVDVNVQPQPAPPPVDERTSDKQRLQLQQELKPLLVSFPVPESSNHGSDLENFNRVITQLIDKENAASGSGETQKPAEGIISASKALQPDDFSWLALTKQARAYYEETGLEDFYALQKKAFNTVKVFNSGPVNMPRPDNTLPDVNSGAEKAIGYYELLYRWAATYPDLFYALPVEWQKLLLSKDRTVIYQTALNEALKTP